MTRTAPCLLALLTLGACKGEQEAVSLLDDADLADLRIEPDQLDTLATRILALAGVVPAGTRLVASDVSTGTRVEATATDTGGFDISMPSAALEDVYALQAEGEEPLVIALADDRSVVRSWAEGWSSEIGCELHGWAGIIGTDAPSPPIDRCRLEALRQDDDAGVEGSIGPVVITASTVMRTRSLVRLVGEAAPSVEVILTDTAGVEHAVGWVAAAVDVFETHSSQLALDAGSAIGKAVTTLAIRSAADSGLVVSDVALIGIEAAPEPPP